MRKEEEGVDAAIQSIAFLIKSVRPHIENYVKTPLPGTSFDEWLKTSGDSLPEPQSFVEWLNQNGDALNETKRR